jgi:hypothetical protein
MHGLCSTKMQMLRRWSGLVVQLVLSTWPIQPSPSADTGRIQEGHGTVRRAPTTDHPPRGRHAFCTLAPMRQRATPTNQSEARTREKADETSYARSPRPAEATKANTGTYQDNPDGPIRLPRPAYITPCVVRAQLARSRLPNFPAEPRHS